MRKSTRKFKEEKGHAELFNLSITQLHYLHTIQFTPGITFKQLAEKFNVQKSTVTDGVGRLISREFVRKEQSSEDLRMFHLFLTKQGARLLSIESAGYYDFAKKMTKYLDEMEKEEFTKLLAKIIDKIDK